MNIEILITFSLYVCVVLGIGLVANRFTDNLSDYVLAGRRLGGSIVALGAGASDMSGWLLMGLPGAAYLYGVNQIWIAVGLSVGAYLNWQFVAPRLRVYSTLAKDSLTIPAFFENRVHDKSRLLRLITALVILGFFTVYAAAGFIAGALLFHSVTGLPYSTALWLGAAFILSYTCIGGFLAVSWTDFLQGILMFIALLAIPIAVVYHLGGWQHAIHLTGTLNPSHLNVFSHMTLISICSLLAWGLGYFGQPHILVRFMAVRNISELPKAKFICMTWMILSLYGAIFVGLFGSTFFAQSPLHNPEIVLLSLAKELFNPWLTGLFLAAVLSAIMSTISAQLLVSSSALTEDLYHRFLRPSAPEKELIWISRITVLIIALIAIYLAHDPKGTLLSVVRYAWDGMGASFGPLMLVALYWRKLTLKGAIAGIVTGAISVLVWQQLSSFGGIFALSQIIPAFFLSLLAIIVVSLLDKPVSQEVSDEFAECVRETKI